MNKKFDKIELEVISDNMKICKNVFDLINNPNLRENEVKKLYEVVIDPLYTINNFYSCKLNIGFDNLEKTVFEGVDLKRGDLRSLQFELNSLQIAINHKGEFIDSKGIELLNYAFEVQKTLFNNFGGK